MTFLSSLYTFIIYPLELLFEVIFVIANRVIGNEGLAIVFLSLAVNFLVLPLYKRADELQAEERDIQAKMAYRIKRTKQTFKGDERFMMLQEYYRINHYKPIYALKSSASLLLQIPFFIAAYRLLSGMQSLQGMSFGFIADLGKEDATFMIGSFPVNILPIVMTLINIVTGIIYTKGQPLKSKIQVYGLAVVFLVLLYHSPAGLVFYWLLNNVFSLVKNVFYKFKNPKKVLSIVLALVGLILLILTIISPDLSFRRRGFILAGCILLWLPLVLIKLLGIVKKKTKKKSEIKRALPQKSGLAFLLGALLMALITGFLIPSAFISASPEEFLDIMHPYYNPFWYIGNSMLLSFGSFVLWGGVFYFFMSDKVKALFAVGMWAMCGVSVFDYMLFGTDLGIISSTLKYDATPLFAKSEYLFNLAVVIAVVIAFAFVYMKFPNIAKTILVVGSLSVLGIGIYNSNIIGEKYIWFKNNVHVSEETPHFNLSQNGKNVVVIMLDRAMGTQAPYIFNEKPELLEQFDGFTYYPNTISYGSATNFASPALYGGYEYTPQNMNKRDNELLVDKHDEALKVMPVLFEENGYNVTVFDPSYAGYSWISDLSIYDEYENINSYYAEGYFDYFAENDSNGTSIDSFARINEIRNRNLFLYSITRISPLILFKTFYNEGLYNESVVVKSDDSSYLLNKEEFLNNMEGNDSFFLDSCAELKALPEITVIDSSSDNNFFMMANRTTHSPIYLQEPNYLPVVNVDNSAYDVDMVDRYTIDGVTMQMETEKQLTHYHVNMAAYIQLGVWFDYLRENGVWDNTRIILVSDHGAGLEQFGINCENFNMEAYMPLLMVKDFNATGFTVCEDFMTNGDTPTLATADIIEDPVNPFTKIPINSDFKENTQYIFYSQYWDVEVNNGYTFLPGVWFALDGDPHSPDSWKIVDAPSD